MCVNVRRVVTFSFDNEYSARQVYGLISSINSKSGVNRKSQMLFLSVAMSLTCSNLQLRLKKLSQITLSVCISPVQPCTSLSRLAIMILPRASRQTVPYVNWQISI